MAKSRKKEKFILTREDWYPRYNNSSARVFKVKLSDDIGWRVGVWGNDDFGYEKDGLLEHEAEELFNLIKDNTSQQDLVWLGFHRG